MLLLFLLAALQITQPQQPATGPGAADKKLSVQKTSQGAAGKQYWIFEPQPSTGAAPVIAFFHAWNALDPQAYGGWIDHLVKRGNIVIYPAYQESATERIPNMTPNAMEALRNALAKLGAKADRSRFAIVGHSLGGVLAFNVAALSGSGKLPVPKVLMSVAPGDTDATPALANRAKLLREGVDFKQIPRAIQTLVLVGDEDKVVADRTAKVLFAALGHVPCENKNFVTVRSDRHGTPPLLADHLAPATSITPSDPSADGPLRRMLRERLSQIEEPKAQADSLDYYAFWKLLDGLTDSAFHGRNRDYALGGGQNQTFMGRWSDGRPVEPLQVSNDPACKAR
jgi:acetyl esterase/lipase